MVRRWRRDDHRIDIAEHRVHVRLDPRHAVGASQLLGPVAAAIDERGHHDTSMSRENGHQVRLRDRAAADDGEPERRG